MHAPVNSLPEVKPNGFLSDLFGVLRQIVRTLRADGDLQKQIKLIYLALAEIVPLETMGVTVLEKGGKRLAYRLGPVGRENSAVHKHLPLSTLRKAMLQDGPCQFEGDASCNHTGSSGIYHHLAAPVRMADGRVGFLLCMRVKPFEPDECEILATVAEIVLSAIYSRQKTISENSIQKVVEENSKLKSIIVLARKIAHELNQPLTGIVGYCTLIQESLSEKDMIFKDLTRIQKQAGRLENLVVKFQNIVHIEYPSENKKIKQDTD